MKVLRLIACAAVLCAALSAPSDAAAQVLSFDKTRIEAGEISEDSLPVYEYACTNTGDKPVRIMRISTTCSSCLKAESSASVIAPGEKAVIRVSYFPKGHPGRFERRIFIFTGESAPAAVLELAVAVKMGEDLVPYYRVNMGRIRMKTAEISFRNGRSEGICLEYLDVTGTDFRPAVSREFLPPYLKVRVTSPSELAADEDSRLEESMKGKVGEICITFDADAFPTDKDTAEVPLMLKGLEVSPSASTIKVKIH